jgi:hypothetical protein
MHPSIQRVAGLYPKKRQAQNFYTAMYSFSGMRAEEIALGMRVRYPRTGTAGTVMRLEQVRGDLFAELDSTHLLYRADQLFPADREERVHRTMIEDAKKVIEREREFAAGSELQDALKNIDQSCEGGG